MNDGPPFVPPHLRAPITEGVTFVQLRETCLGPWHPQMHYATPPGNKGRVLVSCLPALTAAQIWNEIGEKLWVGFT
ncbi:MAG: hypothetical protein ABW167_07660 [Baekduia sp.]